MEDKLEKVREFSFFLFIYCFCCVEIISCGGIVKFFVNFNNYGLLFDFLEKVVNEICGIV